MEATLRRTLPFSVGSLTKFTFQALLLITCMCQSGCEWRRVSPVSSAHGREMVCCPSSASLQYAVMWGHRSNILPSH